MLRRSTLPLLLPMFLVLACADDELVLRKRQIDPSAAAPRETAEEQREEESATVTYEALDVEGGESEVADGEQTTTALGSIAAQSSEKSLAAGTTAAALRQVVMDGLNTDSSRVDPRRVRASFVIRKSTVDAHDLKPENVAIVVTAGKDAPASCEGAKDLTLSSKTGALRISVVVRGPLLRPTTIQARLCYRLSANDSFKTDDSFTTTAIAVPPVGCALAGAKWKTSKKGGCVGPSGSVFVSSPTLVTLEGAKAFCASLRPHLGRTFRVPSNVAEAHAYWASGLLRHVFMTYGAGAHQTLEPAVAPEHHAMGADGREQRMLPHSLGGGICVSP